MKDVIGKTSKIWAFGSFFLFSVLVITCVPIGIYLLIPKKPIEIENLSVEWSVLVSGRHITANNGDVLYVTQSFYKKKDNLQIFFLDEKVADEKMGTQEKRDVIVNNLSELSFIENVRIIHRHTISVTTTAKAWTEEQDKILDIISK